MSLAETRTVTLNISITQLEDQQYKVRIRHEGMSESKQFVSLLDDIDIINVTVNKKENVIDDELDDNTSEELDANEATGRLNRKNRPEISFLNFRPIFLYRLICLQFFHFVKRKSGNTRNFFQSIFSSCQHTKRNFF